MSPYDALLAAAFALVSERCRNAYTHDLNGGLQSVHSAVELLSRSAVMSPVNQSMIEKAASLAKRALATHAADLQEFMLAAAPSREQPSSIDLGRLAAGVVRFLRNDALTKAVTIGFEPGDAPSIITEAHELRMLVLGLCATGLDALPPNAGLHVRVVRHADAALLRISMDLPGTVQPALLFDWLARPQRPLTKHEFLLGVAAEWARRRGGSLVIEPGNAATVAALSLPISPLNRGSSAES